MSCRILAALALLVPLALGAQPLAPPPGDEQPAIRVNPDAGPVSRPAAQPGPVTAAPGAKEDLRDDAGTTVVGERESPIGLYITPWRNAFAEQDIDRPARLLSVDASPVDRDVFARQVEYHSALTEAARAKSLPAASPVTPAAP